MQAHISKPDQLTCCNLVFLGITGYPDCLSVFSSKMDVTHCTMMHNQPYRCDWQLLLWVVERDILCSYIDTCSFLQNKTSTGTLKACSYRVPLFPTREHRAAVGTSVCRGLAKRDKHGKRKQTEHSQREHTHAKKRTHTRREDTGTHREHTKNKVFPSKRLF